MGRENLSKIIKQYSKNLLEYKSGNYNETEVRNDYVNPFFEELGWDVINRKGMSQHLREVKHEATVYVEENGELRKKKPDYSFNAGSEVYYYLETKKPSIDILNNKDAVFQLRRYGWNGNLKISVLTNFTDLLIYDCTVRPCEDDDYSKALIAHYNYSEYVDKFDEIYDLLSRESVVTGKFNEKFDNITTGVKKEPFNEYFLSQIKKWRLLLSQDLVNHNISIEKEELNIHVQTLLNRIIFLRICEDRNLEAYKTLKEVTTFCGVRELFERADRKYDSGLFDLIDDSNYNLTDKTLIDIFQELYYPNSSYEFSVVDPFIIGQIYELFLMEEVIIESDRKVNTILKPEIAAAQGIVNTPKNITDRIVTETLEKLYAGKSLEEVRDYRIADICCGAGNFLLSAYEYIINFYIDYFVTNEEEYAVKEGYIYRENELQRYNLCYKLRREILQKNIFGVDIDPLAVEVSKLSLVIKAIADCSVLDIYNFTDTSGERILPNLDENIKNGNSLIDSKYIKYNPKYLIDTKLMYSLNIFEWNDEFNSELFDAIVGNPPYIRIQNMINYSKDEYEYYKSGLSGLETAQSGLVDKYYLFIERALSLLNSNGQLGYIVPHKFMNIKNGKILRQLLSNNECIRKIVHFGTQQIFKGRDTYTCLLFLSKEKCADFDICFVDSVNNYLYNDKVIYKNYKEGYLSSDPWTFISTDLQEKINSIKSKCVELQSLTDVFVGLQTSADDIYIITAESETENEISFTDKNGEKHIIERNILKPCIYDMQLKKYNRIKANKYIIYPYEIKDGKASLISHGVMEKEYPMCLSYLTKYKNELNKRSIKGRNDDNWYMFGRSQSIKRFSGNKVLIWPVLSLGANYVYDDAGIAFTGGGNGPFYGIELKPNTKESIFYIQAILNHPLIEMIVKMNTSKFRGDYYSHGKQYVAGLPIYNIDFDDEQERKIHNNIVFKVENIMSLNKENEKNTSSQRRKIIERSVEKLESEINMIISKLYNVDVSIIGGED